MWKAKWRVGISELELSVKCRGSSSPTGVWSSCCFIRAVNMHESQSADGRDDTDINNNRHEPVATGAVLKGCSGMARLSNPHDQTSKVTLTHTPRNLLQSLDHPWYLWENLLSWKKQAEDKTEQQDLHLVDSRGPSYAESCGCSNRWKDVKLLHFYSLYLLAWNLMNQWLFLSWTQLHRKSSQYSGWQRQVSLAFCYFNNEICFKRNLHRLWVFDPAPDSRNIRASDISKKGQYLFFSVSWDSNGMSSPRYIFPTLILFP